MTSNSFLATSAIDAAKAHARAEYPKEACGFVVSGKYVPCKNIAEDPLNEFEIAVAVYKKHLLAGGLEAVIHSHPDGPFFPSEADMSTQLNMNLAWGIIPLDDERMGELQLWGGKTPIPDVIGRTFMHGITDCYSLIRDTYRLGKDRLAEQGIFDWPFPPIELPDFARPDNWWEDTDYDFYEVEPPKLGFVEVKQHEVQAGDLFFIKINEHKYGKFNHAGIYLGNNLILHHLPQRLSRREPGSLWGRQAGKWMRYKGPVDAA